MGTGSKCEGCALHKTGAGFTKVEIGDRYGSVRLLLVGEASGEAEARESLPFRSYAQSGSLLADAMRQCNILRSEVAITNVIRCFPGDTKIEAAGLNALYKRWYEGELVTIHVGDRKLSGTPNHPVLTSGGWFPLGKIKEGQYLVNGTFAERMGGSDPDIDNPPPTFEDVFNTFANLSIGGRVVGADMDFHGDGDESEVEIITKESLLRNWSQPSSAEHSHEDILKAAYSMGSRLIRNSSGMSGPFYLFLRQLASTNGGMGVFGNGPFSFWPKLTHSFKHGITTIADFNTMFEEYFAETGLSHMGFSGHALKTLSTQVSFAKITKIERSRFAGHVYNLHTDTEKYTANGFIVHNCRPPKDWLEGAPWGYNAISNCTRNYLIDTIKELKPNAILALGGTAFRNLTSPVKGRYGTLDYARGFVVSGAGAAEGIPVIATYHPAHLRRGAAHLTPLLQRDLRRAFLLATGRMVEGKHYILSPAQAAEDGILKYQTMPSTDEAEYWVKQIEPEAVMVYDIETPLSTRSDEDERTSFADRDIKLVQFTQKRGEGIALPFRDEYREIVRHALHRARRKVGHNCWNFDDPVLEANGIDVGVTDDSMVMYGVYWSDLPKNLQACAQVAGFPFRWKELGETDLEFYGCADVDANLWVYEYIERVLKGECAA